MSEHIFPDCPQTRCENAVTDTCCVRLWVIMYGKIDTKRQNPQQTPPPKQKTVAKNRCRVTLLQKSQWINVYKEQKCRTLCVKHYSKTNLYSNAFFLFFLKIEFFINIIYTNLRSPTGQIVSLLSGRLMHTRRCENISADLDSSDKMFSSTHKWQTAVHAK